MTELELSYTLGIIPDPEKNRVHLDGHLHLEVLFFSHVFQIMQSYNVKMGSPVPNLWLEILPYHSPN